MRASLWTPFCLSILITVAIVPTIEASEIPAFARRYRTSCSMCHTVVPKLSAFGEVFAGNGFRMASNEPPRDTVGTGDDLLDLYRDLPLAMRIDAYLNAYSGNGTDSDFQTPYNIKIMSGGTISRKLSYYLYFFLFERGEIGGIEDAIIMVDDIGGLPLDLAMGQYQVSDPMFKRELRLPYQDYAIYRARVGLQPTDLTYDRGFMLAGDVAGFTLTGQVVNGNGKGEADSTLQLDNDPLKNVFGHVTRDVIPGLRLGAMGYYGRQEGSVDGAPTVENRLWMAGADATVTVGPVEINAQYIHREDDHPTFDPDEERAIVNGGLAEVVVHPARSRWYGLALYNLVHANRPLLNARLGSRSNVEQYHTITGGAGYVFRRNFRMLAEVTWDFEVEETRLTLGLTTAF